MVLSRKEKGALPSEGLLDKLYRVYGHQPIQRDTLGRRPALLSEIEQALARTEEKPASTLEPDPGGEA